MKIKNVIATVLLMISSITLSSSVWATCPEIQCYMGPEGMVCFIQNPDGKWQPCTEADPCRVDACV